MQDYTSLNAQPRCVCAWTWEHIVLLRDCHPWLGNVPYKGLPL